MKAAEEVSQKCIIIAGLAPVISLLSHHQSHIKAKYLIRKQTKERLMKRYWRYWASYWGLL